MINQLAQIISLVAYGNLSLQGREEAKINLSANSSFQNVSSLKFSRHKSNQDTYGLEVANSVSDWFTFLHSIKATRLWNITFAWQEEDVLEHAGVAFTGGEPIGIQADLPNGFEFGIPNGIGAVNTKMVGL